MRDHDWAFGDGERLKNRKNKTILRNRVIFRGMFFKGMSPKIRTVRNAETFKSTMEWMQDGTNTLAR